MPIYEFECTTCSTHFDRLQKLSDPDPAHCPECGKATIRRCLTAPSFRLAGSGWYETDFKKDGDKKRNLVEKGEPKKTDDKPADGAKAESPKSDGGKTQSKPVEKTPAAKPEPKTKPAPAADN
jgi:putative FmdB family regulatory protein